MIKLKQSGDFEKTTKFLNRAKKVDLTILKKYGDIGVNALKNATPVDTGLTAASWYYKIENDGKKVSLSFFNSNINNGVPIAIILQYGHGTRNGGWVQGRDYINPAIRPVFDDILKKVWGDIING